MTPRKHSPPAGVPRLARAILNAALPRDVRDDISGDLEEVFHGDRAAVGTWRARARYWRKTLSFTAHFLAERMRERTRRPRGSRTLLSALDLKLAVRMLARYPGLTAVGVLGQAVAIAIVTGAFGILYTFTNPRLPLDEGDRVVTVVTWDSKARLAERQIVHDFATWQGAVRSIVELGAFRQVNRNLIEDGRPAETVRVAEMSASGFRVARVEPLMGRTLSDDDERAAAPPVAVIGHDVWRDRFQGDPAIVGKPLRLGRTVHTIVGVMPRDFAFPVSDEYWVPFSPDPSRYPRREGPSITVFGRLAEGASMEAAQSELTSIAQQLAAESPATHEHLRARVLPYTYPFFDINEASGLWLIHVFQMIITTLLIVVSINVAILVYARTATRHAELAVRTALGASRGRIVTQLFVEGLVLAAVSTVAGLLLMEVGLRQVNAAIGQVYPQVPFWWKFGLSIDTIAFASVLTLLSGAIVGIIPALKATGRAATGDLKAISAGGGGMQLGRVWTFLIVAQVAIAVALLPPALYHAWDAVRHSVEEPDPLASQVVAADVVMERPDESVPVDAAFRTLYDARHEELERRLESESGVAAVTFAAASPGTEPAMVVEVEGASAPNDPVNYAIAEGSSKGHFARFNRVAPGFFEMFEVPVLAGRSFTAADASATSGTVIVNRPFVDEILGGGQALGRRVRYVGRSREVNGKIGEAFGNAGPRHEQLGHWYEIVGVVADFPAQRGTDPKAKLYHAVTRDQIYPATLMARFAGGVPDNFGRRLLEVSAAIDPALQLREVTTRAEMVRREKATWRIIAVVIGAFMASVVALVAAGIYAMMSFAVARRRREIGIRAALGADPRRILAGLFSRAVWQLALGAAIGMVAAVMIDRLGEGEMLQGTGPIVLPLVAAFMLIVGLAAVAGPARRGLRIQPTEALRD